MFTISRADRGLRSIMASLTNTAAHSMCPSGGQRGAVIVPGGNGREDNNGPERCFQATRRRAPRSSVSQVQADQRGGAVAAVLEQGGGQPVAGRLCFSHDVNCWCVV
jgi:hypothetical protein